MYNTVNVVGRFTGTATTEDGDITELDVVEPEVKITVIIEGETEVSEEDVEPESLFKGHRATLEAQLRHWAAPRPRPPHRCP